MCPKFPSWLLTSKPWGMKWLKVLYDSKRSSRCGPPSWGVKGTLLNRERFQLKIPGPTMASFPALPKPWLGPPFQGATGSANELVLNQAFNDLGYDTFATRLGRLDPAGSPRTSGPV